MKKKNEPGQKKGFAHRDGEETPGKIEFKDTPRLPTAYSGSGPEGELRSHGETTCPGPSQIENSPRNL